MQLRGESAIKGTLLLFVKPVFIWLGFLFFWQGARHWRSAFLIEYHGEAGLEDVDPECEQDPDTTVRCIFNA